VRRVACRIKMKNLYNVLLGRLERKKLLEGPRIIWEDNIEMDLK
jgi:hypothetical protein